MEHNYPKVNFIGNKKKLTTWIINNFPIKSGVVLDLFCGGCSVSYSLKEAGFDVFSNDVLYSNYVLAKALIENNNTVLSQKDIKYSDNARLIAKYKDKINFMVNKLYYDYEIDELSKLLAVSESYDGYQYYMFLSLLRRAMIRKLPYSRMNVPWEQIKKLRDEKYSYAKYGRARAYHNLTFIEHMQENLDNYNNAVFSSKATCKALNYDALEAIKKVGKIDAIYMDPPYPGTMNNYDSFYGVYDEIFNEKKEHTNFNNKKIFLNNLNALINVALNKTKYVILSLNTRVKPHPDEIYQLLSNFGDVNQYYVNHNYQVTGKDNKCSSKELLFVLAK